MTDQLHAMASGTFAGMLRSLSGVLDKAAEHERAAGRDPDGLLERRLAPDMFPLARQVQIACDHAAGATTRLAGQEPQRIDDDETSLAAIQARIARTIDIVQAAPAFPGAQHRRITLPLIDNLVLEAAGPEYLRDWALPHFYFHVVTAYDILRHEGVQIGKRDYLAQAGAHIRPR